MSNSLESKANIAVFNVDFNILMQRRPVIFSGNQFLGFVNSEMACKKIVMMSSDQLRSNGLRNVKKAPILEHSFNIYPSFRKFCSP